MNFIKEILENTKKHKEAEYKPLIVSAPKSNHSKYFYVSLHS